MPDTDATLDGLPRTVRATPGRRHEDVELRGLMRNRWAKRLGAVLVSLAMFWLGNLKGEWDRIPSASWTGQVNAALATVDDSRFKLVQLDARVGALQQAIEANSMADQQAKAEVLGQLRDLRGDLQKWFQQARTR